MESFAASLIFAYLINPWRLAKLWMMATCRVVLGFREPLNQDDAGRAAGTFSDNVIRFQRCAEGTFVSSRPRSIRNKLSHNGQTESCRDDDFSLLSGHDQVIMLDLDRPDAVELLSVLQVLGLDVLVGSGWVDVEILHKRFHSISPIVIIPATDWRCVNSRIKIDAFRRNNVHATICIIVGFIYQAEWSGKVGKQRFSDARATLQAAGICFFSVGGPCDEISA